MAADTGRFPTNLATANAPGAMSAADKVKLTAFADPGWYDSTIAAMKSAAPGISLFVPFSFRDTAKYSSPTIGGITATVTDAGIAGGGLNYVTSGAYPITPTMLLNPSVQPFCFAFRGAFPTPVSGRWSILAFDYGANESMGFASFYAVTKNLDGSDGTDARTKLVVQSTAGAFSFQRASNLVIDGAVHTYMYAWDLSTVKFYVDGVLIASIASATNYVETHACKMVVDGHTAGVVITDLIFGY